MYTQKKKNSTERNIISQSSQPLHINKWRNWFPWVYRFARLNKILINEEKIIETHSPVISLLHLETWIKKYCFKEFPDSSVVMTWCFHCSGLSSIPSLGTKIPQAVMQPPKTHTHTHYFMIEPIYQ